MISDSIHTRHKICELRFKVLKANDILRFKTATVQIWSSTNKNINLSIRQEQCREKMSFGKRPHRILVAQMYHTRKNRFPDILNNTLPAMMKQFAVHYTYCIMCLAVLESSVKVLFL